MKQTSIFSHVKRNNNTNEGVDGNEQYTVLQMQKRYLLRSGPNVIQLPKLENGMTHI